MRGPLHVQGQQILDADGAVVVLKGLNDPVLLPTGGYRRDPVSVAPEDIGGNSVRLLLNWANAEPQAPTVGAGGKLIHDWDEDYFDAIVDTVAAYTGRGIAVLLSPVQQAHWGDLAWKGRSGPLVGQGFPHWLYPHPEQLTEAEARCAFLSGLPPQAGVPGTYWGNLSDYLARIARKATRDELVVGIEPLNEPFSIGWCATMNIDGMYAATSRAIRAANKDILIFTSDTLVPKIKAPLPVSGWVYAFHHYRPTFTVGKLDVENYLAKARGFGVPAWLGEFPAYGYMSHGGHQALDDTAALLALLKDAGCGWSYYDGPPYALSWNGRLRTEPDAAALVEVLST